MNALDTNFTFNITLRIADDWPVRPQRRRDDPAEDALQCHRQQRRLGGRVRQGAQDEAGGEDRYVYTISHTFTLECASEHRRSPAPEHSASPADTLSLHTGDRIIVVVQRQRNFGADTNAVTVSAANKVRRGDIRHAVVVRTKKKLQRKDGSVVRFDDNACVLINKGGEPIGSRLSGTCAFYRSLLSDHPASDRTRRGILLFNRNIVCYFLPTLYIIICKY